METMMKKMIWNVKKEEVCELCQSGTYSFQYGYSKESFQHVHKGPYIGERKREKEREQVGR